MRKETNAPLSCKEPFSTTLLWLGHEAGFCGFELYRQLSDLEEKCQRIAERMDAIAQQPVYLE